MGEVVEYAVERFTPERFMHFWPHIWKELSLIPHIWDRWWTKESIYDLTVSGRFQCWGVGSAHTIHAVAFTEIAVYPASTVFRIFMAFGEGFEEYIPILEASYEKFAVDAGCTHAEVVGRSGWKKPMKELGFEQVNIVLSKSLQKLRMQ